MNSVIITLNALSENKQTEEGNAMQCMTRGVDAILRLGRRETYIEMKVKKRADWRKTCLTIRAQRVGGRSAASSGSNSFWW